EPSYLHGQALRISIFLSLFDVHVNRYPVSGAVELREYEPGRFEPAWRSSASASNERSSTGIHTVRFPVLVRQIAGLAAKRIVTYAQVGDHVRQGERMGLIRFGSRVDVYLPATANVDVRVGKRAVGGVTILARLPSETAETP
nr:phosphatidylserine decarboxylase family protein [Gammaproteobacteria bacterium]